MIKNKKLLYGILVIVVAIMGIGLFVYLSKPTITPSPKDQKTIGESCSIDSDCILPAEPYGLSSYGPYNAKCINSRCKIVFDLLESCKVDSDCDCSSYNPPGLPKEYVACSCISGRCNVIVEE